MGVHLVFVGCLLGVCWVSVGRLLDVRWMFTWCALGLLTMNLPNTNHPKLTNFFTLKANSIYYCIHDDSHFGRKCPLGVCWVSFGCLLGVFWVSVGCLLGVCWVSVGCLLGVRWVSVGCLLGVHWVSIGCSLGVCCVVPIGQKIFLLVLLLSFSFIYFRDDY